MNERTRIWRQASELIESIDTSDQQQAIEHIQKLTDVDDKVKQAAEKLLQLSVSDEFFDAVAVQHDAIKATEITLGDRLDNYELMQVIGQGGMATVYKARRIDSDVQKDVAIKVFDHRNLPTLFLKHFKNEQQILSRLDHENIVSMHHNGVAENGTAFIVMDYVQQAQAIDQFVQGNSYRVKQVAAIINTVAEALSYAHANLVVHRDIKPSNILVNGNDTVKIVDFGIAKLLDQPAKDEPHTLVALTPHYAAPEQIKHRQFSVQSDVFSLAAVMLGLLIDKPPLPDDRLLKQCSTDEQMVANHLKNLPVDQDIKNILNKALQVNPERRYKTMQAFADDLSRWQNQMPIQATPDSWWYRVNKFKSRRKALFASVMTLFVTLTVGIVALLWQVQKTQAEALKANTVKNFMLNTYAMVDPNVSQGSDITAKNLLAASYEEIQHNDDMAEDVKLELIQSMGIAHSQLGEYTKAIEIMLEALKIEPQNPTSQVYLLTAMIANGQLVEAREYLSDIKLTDAAEPQLRAVLYRAKIKMHSQSGEFDQAFEVAEQLKALPVSGVDEIQNNMVTAEIYFDRSEPDVAVKILENTLDDNALKYAATNTHIMRLKYSLSSMYNTVGEPQKAQQMLQNLLHDQQAILGQEHPAYITTLAALAVANRAMGQMPEALENAQLAYDLNVKLRGENHQVSANALQKVGVMKAVMGEYAEAVELFEETVRVFELNAGKNNPNALDVKTDIGMLLGRMGQHQKSLAMLETVYDQQLKQLGPDHRSTLYVQMNLGLTHSYLEHHDQAIEIETAALQAANQHLGEKHPISVNILYALGRVYRAAGMFQQALDQMLQIEQKELLNPNDEKMAPYCKMVSQVYLSLNQKDQAINYARRSLALNEQIYGAESRAAAEAHLFLAEQLFATDETTEALAVLETIQNLIDTNAWQDSQLNETVQALKIKHR